LAWKDALGRIAMGGNLNYTGIADWREKAAGQFGRSASIG
jgi:hypothetical protein